jgi:GR25 family glycosyltransferase involved in LPS biosynthesis
MILKKRRHRQLTLGEFGCLLSHLRAIKNVAKNNNNFGIIFEDDVTLAENFRNKLDNVIKNAPENFDILKLDGTSVKDLFKNNDHRSSFLFSIFMYKYNKYFYNSKSELFHGVSGATGYVITKSCAEKIVRLFNNEIINGLEGAADILLYILLPRKYNYKNIWIIKHPIVYQSGEKSNITSMGRPNI